ncbi:hypothetical protein V8E55_006990 [Tylopilus felleus]
MCGKHPYQTCIEESGAVLLAWNGPGCNQDSTISPPWVTSCGNSTHHVWPRHLLRDSVIHALKFLPGLATGFIHGTTTTISQGANKYTIVRCCYKDKFRRGTTRQEEDPEGHSRAAEQRIPVAMFQHQSDIPFVQPEEPQDPSVPLDIPMSDSPPTSPINDQSPILQSALLENEQEHADLSRNRIQETGSAEQVTRAVTQPLSMITSGEQIMEVPREEEAIVITPSSRPTQVRIPPTEVTAMRTSDPSLNPPEHPVQPMVEQAHEASPAPHRQSPGSITLN